MRYIPLSQVRAAAPAKWIINAVDWTNRVAQAVNKSDEIKNIGNKWGDLKVDFINAFGDKCWYTEAPRIATDNDVDHFRPKAGAKMKNTKTASRTTGTHVQQHQGYWWLAYEVSNYRYSSVFANRLRGEGGKGEYFPLEDESSRAWTISDPIANEDITLLDPCNLDDVKLIKFDHTPGLAVSKYDQRTNPTVYERFEQSKKFYNLNESTIVKARLGVIDSIKKDLLILELLWDMPSNIRSMRMHQITSTENSIILACDRKSSFSAAVIAIVNTKIAMPWMASLLLQIDLRP
jgi:hypothetical protein